MTHPSHLCIHGHFYQPPRENPWLQAVERQESAAPAHDWNERVSAECYQPNTLARIYDDQGRVAQAVNNFEWISFNIGPTLFSWLESQRPRTYRYILEADQKSLVRNQGHGNALAQAYNHMILPLANPRDQATQVRWGLADFQHRFRRNAEALWLPETACNRETLALLARHGLKFAILAPSQAQRVRLLSGGPWQDVANGSIDPTQPYRCVLSGDGSLFLDVFFYDGPVSSGIGFQDTLATSDNLARYLSGARPAQPTGPHLVHAVTDGETYGHHKPYGDRVLAHFMLHQAPRMGFQLTNYGWYLAHHPPQWEVEVKPGPDGLGTAWSCAHGLGRWREDCGCRGGGPEDWKQHWRAPLRQALDWLRDQCIPLFEQHGGRLLTDPWATRDAYIQAVLNRDPAVVDAFLDSQGVDPRQPQDARLALTWLEQQHNAMLMYTSCAWFFTELSGLETIQVLKYASRALELVQQACGHNLEPEFLAQLALAPSNDPHYKDGLGVYDKLVRPSQVSHQRLAAHYAMGGHATADLTPTHLYNHQVQPNSFRQAERDDLVLSVGSLTLTDNITRLATSHRYALLRMGHYDFRFSAQPPQVPGDEDNPTWPQLEEHLFQQFPTCHIMELFHLLDTLYGNDYLSFEHLLADDQWRILGQLTRANLTPLRQATQALYQEYRRLGTAYHHAGLTPPPEYQLATAYHLQYRLLEAVHSGEDGPADALKDIDRIVTEAQGAALPLDMQAVQHHLEEDLRLRMDRLSQGHWEEIPHCQAILHMAETTRLHLDLLPAQDAFLSLARDLANHHPQTPMPNAATLALLHTLGQALLIHTAAWLGEQAGG